MKKIMARIEDWIYSRLKETELRYNTWNAVVNQALAEYIERRSSDPLEKAKAIIVKNYYEAKALKRIIMMLYTLERDYTRLSDMMDIESNPVLLRLVSEVNEIVRRMREKLDEVEEKILEKEKERGVSIEAGENN